MKRIYVLMDCGADFTAANLWDIRAHIRMMSDKDKQSIEGCPIVGYNAKGEEIYTRFIRFRGGNVVFSKK